MSRRQASMTPVAGLVAVAMLLAACGTQSAPMPAPEAPARVVPVAGTNLHLITLTPRAVQRIDLQTATVQRLTSAGGTAPGEVVPVASLIYLSDGTTWVYTAAAPRTFERQSVTVVWVANGMAMLRAGPPAGSTVVTVGTAELLGAEQGVAGGQ